VADLVVVGEGGACWRPFGVRRQEGVGRLSGTTVPPPRHDQTYEPTDPREHLFPRLEVAGAAEAVGHHPDIDIRWNKVTLALSSHAEGGLTERDFQLAARIQELDQPPQPA
jgi:4a-hydroxytetrahydrobiopterin dehydratase